MIKKKSMLALLLIFTLILSYSTAMAYEYQDTSVVSGQTVTMIGKIISPTMFYGSTSWIAGRRVSVYATTFTTPAGESKPVAVENGSVAGYGSCRIDQTHEKFPLIGTYSISAMDFAHAVYSADESQQLLYLKKTLP